MSDNYPVHRDPKDCRWYFWDESGANRYGPYLSERLARLALRAYCDGL